MTISFTDKPSMSGEEPIELLRQLAFEYLMELERRRGIELLEITGIGGVPCLLAVIPNAKVLAGKITTVGKEEKDVKDL